MGEETDSSLTQPPAAPSLNVACEYSHYKEAVHPLEQEHGQAREVVKTEVAAEGGAHDPGDGQGGVGDDNRDEEALHGTEVPSLKPTEYVPKEPDVSRKMQ